MKPFFESLACTSQVHCGLCRDLAAGREWRKRVIRDALRQDFECPRQYAWGFKPSPKAIAHRERTPYQQARAGILAMDTRTENGKFLRAMLAQIEQLIKERRCGSCREKKAYAKRMREKIVYLFREYGTTESSKECVA